METIDPTQLNGMAHLLVEENLLSKSDARHYQLCALEKRVTLVHYLALHEIFSAKFLAQMASQHFNLPFFDLSNIDQASIPSSLLNHSFFHQQTIALIALKDNHLSIAIDDPILQMTLKNIQFHTGYQANFLIVETDKLYSFAAQNVYKNKTKSINNYFEKPSSMVATSQNEISIIQLVNQILFEALKRGVSDIHLESYDEDYRIRYRQDGVLITFMSPPFHLSNKIIARLKIMANLDISERRLPQDGRFHFFSPDRSTIHARVSICPTVYGEKIVIRLLDSNLAKPSIENLGFESKEKKLFLNAIAQPQGIILVTGPTGSGKTMTLYSALNLLNTPEKNICAVEDPVELRISGINQVHVNPKIGLDFSQVLRSFLRQDPDVIMIGEIRDLETADVAVKAALTGHLVLSTLHTNSAVETLSRLSNMGIAPFNLVCAIHLIIAQRLVRRLCEHCKMARNDLTSDDLKKFGIYSSQQTIYQAKGCDKCHHGYLGRIGIFEVLPMSQKLRELILSGAHALQLDEQAQIEGMHTLYEAGMVQVKQGKTTLEEIERVTTKYAANTF